MARDRKLDREGRNRWLNFISDVEEENAQMNENGVVRNQKPLELDWQEVRVLENALFWHAMKAEGTEKEVAEKIFKWARDFNKSIDSNTVTLTSSEK